MNKEDDYPSTSESDEDFNPENEVAADSDAPSEEEGTETTEDEELAEKREKPAKGRRKVASKQRKRTRKHLATTNTEADDSESDKSACKRSTRQTDIQATGSKDSHEKDVLDSDEEEKSRTDALWADFLTDVKKPVAEESGKTIVEDECNDTSPGTDTGTSPPRKLRKEEKKEESPVNTIGKATTTETASVADEDMGVGKMNNGDSIKENKLTPRTTRGVNVLGNFMMPGGLKRPAASTSSSGIGSLLNQIGKKKKLSVLEKSKMDWNSFKQDTGIEEELQTHNKGKDGYLERQDFLQRTDLRQFEIERNLRQARRNK